MRNETITMLGNNTPLAMIRRSDTQITLHCYTNLSECEFFASFPFIFWHLINMCFAGHVTGSITTISTTP